MLKFCMPIASILKQLWWKFGENCYRFSLIFNKNNVSKVNRLACRLDSSECTRLELSRLLRVIHFPKILIKIQSNVSKFLSWLLGNLFFSLMKFESFCTKFNWKLSKSFDVNWPSRVGVGKILGESCTVLWLNHYCLL